MMLRKIGLVVLLCLMTVALPGCGVITVIFKAGVGVGIFVSILVVGSIVFVVMKARG